MITGLTLNLTRSLKISCNESRQMHSTGPLHNGILCFVLDPIESSWSRKTDHGNWQTCPSSWREGHGYRAVEKWRGQNGRFWIGVVYRGMNPNLLLPFLRLQYIRLADDVFFLLYLQLWRGKHTKPGHKSSSAARQNPGLPELGFWPVEPVPQLGEV